MPSGDTKPLSRVSRSSLYVEDTGKGVVMDTVSQYDCVSGMTSDTLSDLCDDRHEQNSKKGRDNDQSTSSTMRGRNNKRQDKSLKRKPKLNKSRNDFSSDSRDGDSSDGRHGDSTGSTCQDSSGSRYQDSSGSTCQNSSDDSRHQYSFGSRHQNISDDRSSRTERGGIIRQNSSAHKGSKEDKQKGDQEVSSSVNPLDTNQSKDELIPWTNSMESPRLVIKSVLENNPVLPSRLALPSKVFTATPEFNKTTETAIKDSSHVVKKPEDQNAAQFSRQGNNFSQLLQKFSGSEASSSKKSDSETPCASKVLLKRQEACSHNNSSSDKTSKTPERTQSLRLPKQKPSEVQLLLNSVARSSSFKLESFKSEYLKQRTSPELDNKRLLPHLEQSIKQSPELASNTEVLVDKTSYNFLGQPRKGSDSSVSKSDKSQNPRKPINIEKKKLCKISLMKPETQRTEELRSNSSCEDKSKQTVGFVQSEMTDLGAPAQQDNDSNTGQKSLHLKTCINITSPAKVKEFSKFVNNDMQPVDDVDKQTLQDDANNAKVSAQEFNVQSNVEQAVHSQPQNVSLSGSTLVRTESVGRSDSERPKGILKRTPSLKQTGVIVDPEFAKVLKSRWQHHDGEEEIEEKKLTAEEEIQRAREEAQNEVSEQECEVSVAQRVFQMHTKIEEVKSCPVTPRRGSRFTTSKSGLHRSGDTSPRDSLSFDKSDPKTSLFSSQLIGHLSNLKGCPLNILEKHMKFQLRKCDPSRTRTQPVTWQEIQLADSLETVQKFRSEVIQKASINIFEAIQKQEKSWSLTETEFLQPYRIDRRQRGQRHRTIPITAAELKAIPEVQIEENMNSLKKKQNFGAQDSKTDSGILSSSDGDNLDADSWRNVSVKEDNIGEDDPVKLSVSAKASMFLQLQESQKERLDKKSASGVKRYIDRKKRERSRTLPITEDEVKLAGEIADNEEDTSVEVEFKITVMSESIQSQDSVADDLSRISLANKVKLFTAIEEEKKLAAQKKGVPLPPPKLKNRKLASRFATQPVTYEEVEKAAKISPLACSLVKPPDPDIISGLSVKDQRDLMAKHAQICLSQPSLYIPSRKAAFHAISIGDLSGDATDTDPQTATNTDLNKNYSTMDTSESKEILKPSTIWSQGFVQPIKHEEYHSSQITEKVSLITTLDSAKKSNVKAQLEERLSLLHKGLTPNRDTVPTVCDIKKLLKKDASTDDTLSVEVRGTLNDTNCNKNTMEIDNEKTLVSTNETFEGKKDNDSEENEIESSGDNLDSDEEILDSKGVDHEQDTPKRRKEKKSMRRFNRERQSERERYKTQPAEVPSEAAEEVRLKKRYSGRHITQPVTLDEKKVAEITIEMPEMIKTGSISDRLNALKKSGEEEWKKRLSRNIDLDKIDRRSSSPPDTSPSVRLREKKGLSIARPSRIADRLSLLDSAQEGWRDRVGETDVKTFTIEHKITSSGQNVGQSPLVERLKGKSPRKEFNESSETVDIVSPTSSPKPQPREIICIDLPPEVLTEQIKSPSVSIPLKDEENRITCVEVPNIGADIDTFFQRTNDLSVTTPTIDVSIDDFNELFINANDMLEIAKKVRPKRRHNPSSRNPLKTMSVCLDVRTEYTEVITGVAERQLKSAKVAASFAVEALAGLASMENFAKVELRKIDSNEAGSPSSNVRLEPYLPLMLIHIKGRRHVQCRLVEPCSGSINSGDCFILVTPDRIMQWIGEYSNIIEKAKAADVCDFIKRKHDLGCKNARCVVTVEEKKGNLGNGQIFWDLLGGHDSYMSCGPPEEDELYETHIVDSNMIYRLDENKLVPWQDYWGNQPKYEMLSSDQVLVFDFGSELYLWQGKCVSPNQRKVSLKLVQQLWNQGYDYSDCEINPLSPLRDEEHGGLPNVCDKRPHWTLLGKVNENMETILFREKFADWPDSSRLIKVKSLDEINAPKFDLADLKACDAKLMIPINTQPVTLLLDGSNVGRGIKWEQDMGGFMQEQIIETLKVRVWHVLEYDHYEIESHSYGQFHEGDTYVIRWQYMIVNAGTKSLKNQTSRFSQFGRERCAYFFWQGKSSTINEKGASALMTVELDEERGPQVRVSEGKEPPCFLNLFGGRMIIHIGKREDESTNTQGPWRFYCLRNEYENEMCLIEVPKDISNLRSVSSCLILNIVTGKLAVWHGCKSPEHTKKLAFKAAENLKTRCPLEVGLHKSVTIDITELEEGKERTYFWRIMNEHIGDRSKYNSLIDNPQSFSHTLRVFHMTSVSGVFEAHEILNPSRTHDLPTRFPVLQTELYMAQQPALFLIDNDHEVFLWQGWWPEGSEEQENVQTGSAQTRFSVDRKCAMETTLEYCKEINSASPPPAYIVYAGVEPLSFTNLFPFWSVDVNVREINLKDGKKKAELMLVQDLLKKLTKMQYSLAELLGTHLPEGVDPLKLESYLSDKDFETVLEMNREAFYALPSWKQFKFKQQAGLY